MERPRYDAVFLFLYFIPSVANISLRGTARKTDNARNVSFKACRPTGRIKFAKVLTPSA